MKRTPLTQRIVTNLKARGYKQVRRSNNEVVLRSRKHTFIIQNCGRILSLQNKVAREICCS